jgi:dTDP-4-amino-4,6-dideoxygalactose transaminase
MQISLVDLQQQTNSIKKSVMKRIETLLDSSAFIMGQEVSTLEDRFCLLTDVKSAISCNSGTDALVLILEAMGIGKEDEVITSPFTFFATAESISRVGAIPVFVDVNEETFNIDPQKIENAISRKTKAILPVHIFGQPAEMESILDIAKKYKVRVVEDACQAIGAKYTFSNGVTKQSGALGDAAAFSFYPTKNLGAFGDGGMITTNDNNLAQIVKALRVHGSGQNGKKAFEFLYDEMIESRIGDSSHHDSTAYDPAKYYNYLIGMNSRLDALQAAILNVKLDYLTKWNQQRKKLGQRYSSLLASAGLLSRLSPQHIPNHIQSVYHLYIVKCEERDKLVAFLSRHGIATGIYYPVPLHLQKVYQTGKYRLSYKPGDLPISEALSCRTMALPLFPEMTEDQQDFIVDTIKRFYTTH